MRDLNEEDLLELQRLMTSEEDEPGDLHEFLQGGLVSRKKSEE